jgi:hypothetical protein
MRDLGGTRGVLCKLWKNANGNDLTFDLEVELDGQFRVVWGTDREDLYHLSGWLVDAAELVEYYDAIRARKNIG